MFSRLLSVLGLCLTVMLTLEAPSVARAQAAKPVVKVAIGARGTFTFMQFQLAKQFNYFAEEGLDVQLSYFPGGPAALTALLSGSVDFTGNAMGEIVSAAKAGRQLVMLNAFSVNPALVLAVDARHASAIKSVKDLKGQRVGVTQLGAGSQLLLNNVLYYAGLKSADVTAVPVGTDTGPAALEAGAVAAMMTLDPFATVLKESGKATWLVDLTHDEDVRKNLGAVPYQYTGMLTTKATVDSKPDLVQKMVNAVVRACRYMLTTPPGELVASLPTEFTGENRDLFQKGLVHVLPSFARDCAPTYEGVVNYIRSEVVGGFTTEEQAKGFDPKTMFDRRFAEKAFATSR